jgi:hypothetical protein
MWGNHPLGHAVQCGAYLLARRAGYDGRALPVLKIASGTAAAAAVAAFFIVLFTGLGIDRLRAAGWAAVLGSGYGFWRFAGTADVYSLSLFLLIVAWGSIVRTFLQPSTALMAAAGVLAGVATLAHQLNGVLLAAAAIGLLPLVLFKGRGSRRLVVSLTALSIAAGSTVVVGYLLLGSLATGSSSSARIVGWARGYAGDPTYGRFMTLQGLTYAVYAVGETLMRSTSRWPAELLRRMVGAACIALPFIGALWIRRLPGGSRTIALSCGLQCLAGWLLIIMWEPGLVGKFWLLTLPAVLVWLEYAVQGLESRGVHAGGALRAAPLALGAFLLAFNWSLTMRHERRPDQVFEGSLQLWLERSRQDDVLIEAGRFTAHLRFWGARSNVVNLYRSLQNSGSATDPFAQLRGTIDGALRQGRPVLFAPGLSSYFTEDRLAVVGTNRRDLERFFERYRWDGPLFEYQESAGGPIKPVYRLRAAGPSRSAISDPPSSTQFDPPPRRLPHVGGGGSVVIRFGGLALRSRVASSTARSSCGSRPAMTSFGQFSTSMSGPTPSFSTAHFPSRVKKPPRGAIIDPPSMKPGVSAVWTRPPQVRLPTSGPILRWRNM